MPRTWPGASRSTMASSARTWLATSAVRPGTDAWTERAASSLSTPITRSVLLCAREFRGQGKCQVDGRRREGRQVSFGHGDLPGAQRGECSHGGSVDPARKRPRAQGRCLPQRPAQVKTPDESSSRRSAGQTGTDQGAKVDGQLCGREQFVTCGQCVAKFAYPPLPAAPSFGQRQHCRRARRGWSPGRAHSRSLCRIASRVLADAAGKGPGTPVWPIGTLAPTGTTSTVSRRRSVLASLPTYTMNVVSVGPVRTPLSSRNAWTG